MAARINAVMMPCFVALSGILPQDQAIAEIKRSFEKSYGKRGRTVVERNNAAVDAALAQLHEVPCPPPSHPVNTSDPPCRRTLPTSWPVTAARMLAGDGDRLPVSALCQSTAHSPQARRVTRSVSWPPRSPSGIRSCASTAPSARWCAHMPPSA